MTRLVWGLDTNHKYEAGVDRGVLYPPSAPGVVWNGLISVEESFIGGEVTPLHFDGVKYLDVVTQMKYQATLTAFSAPEEFRPHLGDKSVIPGFVLTRQARTRFGLSYRTRIDDGKGYKIHLVYNAVASSNGGGGATLNPTATPQLLSWKIDAVPSKSDEFRPSPHFVFDSTKMRADALNTIEDILYGSDTSAPRLPTLDELLDLLAFFTSVLIVPDTVSGLAELIPGVGDLYMTRVDGILHVLPDTRLVETVVAGLYELEL